MTPSQLLDSFTARGLTVSVEMCSEIGLNNRARMVPRFAVAGGSVSETDWKTLRRNAATLIPLLERRGAVVVLESDTAQIEAAFSDAADRKKAGWQRSTFTLASKVEIAPHLRQRMHGRRKPKAPITE